MKTNKNSFFFEDISTGKKYQVRHTFFETLPEEMCLQVALVSEYQKGKLYQITCDFAGEFTERFQTGTDRLSLGYFYVQDNSNMIYRIREENMTDEIMRSEEQIMLAGTVVCQEEEKKDALEEDEKGWHERIEINGEQRAFYSYNNLSETGFYERFVWERGRGLIRYSSGFGAERDMIELNICDQEIEDNTEK